jgi:hypothetical protein
MAFAFVLYSNTVLCIPEEDVGLCVHDSQIYSWTSQSMFETQASDYPEMPVSEGIQARRASRVECSSKVPSD